MRSNGRGYEVRKRDLDKFRKLLIAQRELLIENARRALAGDIHLDPDTPNVRFDPTQFEQVLVNLAANARDAMASGVVAPLVWRRTHRERTSGVATGLVHRTVTNP